MERRTTNQSVVMCEHIAACKARGQTVAAYCSSHQLKPHQYYYWQKRLQEQEAPGKFLSITPLVSNAPVLLTFINGNRIGFETLPPVEYIKQLAG